MKGEIKYVIEHAMTNHKKVEKEMEAYCVRKWSSRTHKMMYRNVGEPKFYHTRNRVGGSVIACQKVDVLPLGYIRDRIIELLFKVERSANI